MDGYCDHCKTVFEVMGCYFHFCGCLESKWAAITDEKELKRLEKRRAFDQEKKDYLQEAGFQYCTTWECDWRHSVESNQSIKNFVSCFEKKQNFKRTKINEADLLSQIGSGQLFGVIECDLSVPDEDKDRCANFPPLFKNTDVDRDSIGEYMKEYAESKNLMTKPRRLLISNFHPQMDFLLRLSSTFTSH